MKVFIALLLIILISCNQEDKVSVITSLSDTAQTITVQKPATTGKDSLKRTTLGSKKIYLNKNADGSVWSTGGVTGGDTLVIQAKQNPFTWAYFSCAGSDSSNPVVIIPEGGVVQLTSIGFGSGAKYIKMDGRLKDTLYGFNINQHANNDYSAATAVVSIEGTASDIVFMGWQGDSAQYGIWMKNEHFCDSLLQFHVFNNCEFAYFKMRGIRQHGSYIGATEIENTTRPSSCNGVDKLYNPSRIGNLKIHDGIIRAVGKNGLMVSDARVGRSEIWNMDIDSTGRQLDPAQGHGIASGGASNLYIHDNKINNTWLAGIAVFGGADVIVENNVIGKTGTEPFSGKKSGWTEPIRSVTDPRIPFKCSVTIRGNTIGEGAEGLKKIGIYKGNYESVSVCDNGDATIFSEVNIIQCTPIPQPPKPVPDPIPVPKAKMIHELIWNKKKYYLYSDSTWSSLNKK
jgi:hypothetical protein